MGSGLLQKAKAAVGPEPLLFALAVYVARSERLAHSLADFIEFYPYAVVATGLVLAWRFQRSRLLFALVVLALAHEALDRFATGAATTGLLGRIGFQAAAVFVPLNLAAIALLPERGVVTPSGLRRWAMLLGQLATFALLVREGGPKVAAALEYGLLPARLLAWTPVAQPALLACLGALALVITGRLLAPGTTGRGYFWAVLAVVLAFSTRPADDRTTFLATAGLMLLVAMIESSYRLAYQDGLTGLPGRRALNEALERLEGQYTVAMVDVDHFKRINDEYGHDIGDQVLRMVASRLGGVGNGGKAYRYGGEEFAVVFSSKSVDDCVPALEEARKAIEDNPFTVRGRIRPRKKPAKAKAGGRRRQVTVTVSIGVAERGERHGGADQVVQAADRALYKAKDEGRNRVCT